MSEKKSVVGFVLGWVTGHRAESKEAEEAMRDTGHQLGLAFGEGVMSGIAEARDEALGMPPVLDVPSTPVNRIANANGKVKATRKKVAKK